MSAAPAPSFSSGQSSSSDSDYLPRRRAPQSSDQYGSSDGYGSSDLYGSDQYGASRYRADQYGDGQHEVARSRNEADYRQEYRPEPLGGYRSEYRAEESRAEESRADIFAEPHYRSEEPLPAAFSRTAKNPADANRKATAGRTSDSRASRSTTGRADSASRAASSAARSASSAARRQAGGRRKAAKKRSFPTIPAVAGAATLVAASAGAITLTSQAAGAGTPTTVTMGRSVPANMALGANRLTEARDTASDRANRSKRIDLAAKRDRDRKTAKERAAWAAQRSRELAAAEKSGTKPTDDTAVIDRVIEWVSPIGSYRLSAGFGQSSSLWSNRHTGQDFAAPLGTPVRSVGIGRVISVGRDGPYGQQIRIQHPNGTETWYCHLSRYGTSEGSQVAPGEIIGYVGSTGNSTGPHLHFEVRPDGGDPIDPMPWLRNLGINI